jgi:DNA polymerase-1
MSRLSRNPPAAAPPRLYLVDGSGYVHRAFHALPALTTSRGQPTNAVLGFARMLTKLLREEGATHVIVVFDAPGPTFRQSLYDRYKEHRPPMADDLRAQIPYIRRLVAGLRVPVLEVAGVEADDVLATLATHAEAAGLETVVVSADKDLAQIVTAKTVLYDEMRGRRIGVADVEERFGVPPERVPDLFGLTGDSSDDIPGVPGIGPKSAAVLIRSLGPVDEMLARLGEVEGLELRGAKRVRAALEAHADVARLSRTLATVRRDVPVTFDVDAARWPGPDPEVLEPLLAVLEFAQLARELCGPEGRTTAAVERRLVERPEDVAALVKRLARGGEVGVGVVYDSPRRTVARLGGIALAAADGPVHFLPGVERPEVLRALAPLLEDMAVAKVGDDLKGLRVALARRRVGVSGSLVDLGLASYCLDPTKARHDALGLAQELRGEPPPDAGDPTEVACRSARAARQIRTEVLGRLATHEVLRLFTDLETPLASVLVSMELAGITLDVEALAVQSAEIESTLAALLRSVHELAGTEFNVNSPVQLREVLFERLGLSTRGVRRTKTGLSTDVDVLTKLAAEHPLPAEILEYRTLAKLKSTYLDALPALVDPTSGRVHTSFNQTVAATGRLSSSDPNLQNIPIRTDEGRRIRSAFVAGSGRRLVAADYSQIELRLLAHFCGDRALVEAFTSGEDVHARTAADVFPALSLAEGRRLAKVINYGILYGMGPARAARELGVSVREASAYIKGYFDRFAGVRAYLDGTVAQARERGFVATILGRRRYLPELGSRDAGVRQFAERAAVNTPIQGSAADLIKLAMLEVDRRLREEGLEARVLLQVHDELVVEAMSDDSAAVAAVLRAAMEGVWRLAVPLSVEVRTGRTWAEVH